MILYCAADNNYYNYYFDLWNKQTKKIYPDLKRHIVLHNPTKEQIQKCIDNDIDYNDVTLNFPKNPIRKHFYLLRWLFLPIKYKENILETQINCLPLKRFDYPKVLKVEQWRIQRPKRGVLGGVSAAIFTPQSARQVINQAKHMLPNPPENDHEMNMWQINNLSQHQEKLEHQIRGEESLPEHAYWITARTAQVWTHEQKIKALERFCK